MKSENFPKVYLYQGDKNIINEPTIRIRKYNKEFGPGEYFHNQKSMAARTVERYKSPQDRNINAYVYKPEKLEGLNIKIFRTTDDEWIEFVINCLDGVPHNYDMVEGPALDDQSRYWIMRYRQGRFSKSLIKGQLEEKHPNSQICLLTDKALECLSYEYTEESRYSDYT